MNKEPNVEDDSSCLLCKHSEMGYCRAHDMHVRPLNNCSDFPVKPMFEMFIDKNKQIKTTHF